MDGMRVEATTSSYYRAIAGAYKPKQTNQFQRVSTSRRHVNK